MAAGVADPAVHATDRIHEIFSWLRENEPLGIARRIISNPSGSLRARRKLREIAKLPEIFNNGDRIVLVDRTSEERMAELLDGRKFPIRTILQMDPPEHEEYRALTAEYFHARSVDKLADSIAGSRESYRPDA